MPLWSKGAFPLGQTLLPNFLRIHFGDVFTFGLGYYGALGYYDYDYSDYCRIEGAPPSNPEEYGSFCSDLPRRVDALSGKTVVGAAGSCAVWTDE